MRNIFTYLLILVCFSLEGQNIKFNPTTGNLLLGENGNIKFSTTESYIPAFNNNAFPGAEGFGSLHVSAYTFNSDPTILYVDTLADASIQTSDTSGSLRWVLTRSYNRIVLFEVSGRIQLTASIQVNDGDLSVYGQSAPGQGISIENRTLILNASNILIQHIRFRHGAGVSGEDCLTIAGGSNIIVDHCSFAWAPDECASTSGSFDDSLTFSNNIVSEPTGDGNSYGFLAYAGDYFSFFRNAFVHCSQRQPLINSTTFTTAEVINNHNYNPRYHPSMISGGNNPQINYIGNYLKKGSNSGNQANYFLAFYSSLDSTGTGIYLEDNWAQNKVGECEWCIVDYNDYWGRSSWDSTMFRSETPVFTNNITTFSVDSLQNHIESYAGAYWWDRDTADTRAIDDVVNTTGAQITDETDVGGFTTLEEYSHSWNITSPNNDDDSNGWTNIQEIMYWLQYSSAKRQEMLNLYTN